MGNRKYQIYIFSLKKFFVVKIFLSEYVVDLCIGSQVGMESAQSESTRVDSGTDSKFRSFWVS